MSENEGKSEGSEEKINFKDFESKYLSFEQGEQKTLVLSNWRQDWRQYKDSEPLKPRLVFDVMKEGVKEYGYEQKFFATGALSFVNDVKPIIEKADAAGAKFIKVVVKYGRNKKYTVLEV